MKLYRVALTKAQLSALPREDRVFLLQLGHACNEITVLQKLIIVCMNRPSPQEIARQAEAGQALVIARLLMGKLNEAWELIRTRMLASASVGAKYGPLLDDEGKRDLETLKQYFGRSNIINTVRSRYAFHTPHDEDIERGFRTMPDTEPWQFYLSEARANSYYHAADMVVGFSIANIVDPNDVRAGFERLLDDAVKVGGAMGDLLNSCIGAVFVHHFGESARMEQVLEMAMPELSHATLSFFFEPTKDPLQGVSENDTT